MAGGEQTKSDPQDTDTLLRQLNERLNGIAQNMEKTQIADYVDLMNRPRKLIFRNLLAGVSRGVGYGVGFTFFAAAAVLFLRKLGALNLPIIGDFIADLVRIVQAQLDGRVF
ncbi:DUF5665 domain-containing protein [Paenibacillus gansuensis]|uniref:DUF5665 domain-containing protein n=1 Tax=Paenibacillus gansuensis TaxID=306542 RepID=A0ABW5PBX6_9BACL